MADSSSTTSPARRPWWVPRFSLRTIFVLVTVFALTFGWYAERSERQRRVTNYLEDMGCRCERGKPSLWVRWFPKSLQELRGGHYYWPAEYVELSDNLPFNREDHRRALSNLLSECRMLPALRRLELPASVELRPEVFESIARIGSLEELSFTAAKLDASFVPAFRKLRSLKRVDFQLHNGSSKRTWRADVTRTSAETLSELTSITDLQLSYCDDMSLRHLAKLSRLESLVIDAYDGQGADLARLAKSLRLLRIDRSDLTDEHGAALANFPLLETVALPQSAVADATAVALAGLPNLKRLDLSETLVGDAGIEALAKSQSLKDLTIDRAPISSRGLAAIAQSRSIAAAHVDGIPMTFSDLKGIAATKTAKGEFWSYSGDITLTSMELERFGYLHFSPEEAVVIKPKLAYANQRIAMLRPVTDDSLRTLCTLDGLEFDLSWSHVTDEGMAHLPRVPSLLELDLTGTAISAVGLEHLTSLRSLERLMLGDCGQIDGAAIPALLRMPALNHINIKGTAFSREDCLKLAAAKEWSGFYSDHGNMHHKRPDLLLSFHLKKRLVEKGEFLFDFESEPDAVFPFERKWLSLNLSREGPLTDDQVAQLAKSILMLGLRAELTDQQFARLDELKSLTEIGLIGPQVGKASVERAIARENLKRLSLGRVEFSDNEWLALRGARIESLVLDEVTVSAACGEAMATMPNLAEVVLLGSTSSDEALRQLIRHVPKLERLSIDHQRCSPECIKQTIMAMESLEQFHTPLTTQSKPELASIRGKPKSRGDSKSTISTGSRNIQTILLIGPWVDDSVWLPDANDQQIQAIAFRWTRISGETLESLSTAHVETLDLTGSSLTNADFHKLPALPRATQVVLQECPIGNEALERIASARYLLTLNLRATQVDDNGLAHLANWPKLQSLDLAHTSVGDAGMGHLRNTRRLDDLDLSATRLTDEGLAHLGSLRRLRKLVLANTGIGDQGLKALQELYRLQHLDLRDTGITDAGLEHLQALSLAIVDLRGTQATPSGVHQMRSRLPHCRIVLQDSDLPDMDQLAEALDRNFESN